ncbi:DUF4145 domain-containing protein [Vibrio harveyi]
MRNKIRWYNTDKGDGSAEYLCAYCENKVASHESYSSDSYEVIAICPHCTKPTYLSNEGQLPQAPVGNKVEHLPELVEALYTEARNCVSVGAYTSSVLASRKLLMNIAVSVGASEGDRFISYVNYLADKGYFPPNGRLWVDQIRKKGNEATHEIALMTHQDATDLITFSEMLMKFIYEFPAKMEQEQT